LLTGIINTVALRPGVTELPTRAIAEHVLELYYPQTRPYVDRNGIAHRTRQITLKSSPVIRAVETLRSFAESIGARDLQQVARRHPTQLARTVEVIEDTFVRYPIPLLQRVGAGVVPFLFAVDWPEGTSIRSLRSRGLDRIRLLEGVADQLAVLGPMLRPLIELHWRRDVARWSAISTEDEDLQSHLFGRDRSTFPAILVAGLRELQEGQCFYCRQPLEVRGEVDHFLPWSRWPNDAIENLVLADRCNGAKSNHLAALRHVDRWRRRLHRDRTRLAQLAERAMWATASDRSEALTHTTYGHLAPGTPLWIRGREFELTSGPAWT